jgi:hypothetical protein
MQDTMQFDQKIDARIRHQASEGAAEYAAAAFVLLAENL